MRHHFPFIVSLSLALCLPSALVYGADRALLIGINRYQEVRGLKGPLNDVDAFHQMLTQQLGFKDSDIRELKDDAASRAGILATMDEWLAQGSQAGDRVVFYYSGHGDNFVDRSGDEDDQKDEALIPYDAKADGSNWLLDDEIGERMKRLAGREVLAVFDSCHSGTVTRGAFDDEEAKVPSWTDGQEPATRGITEDVQHQKEGGFIAGGGNITAFFAVAPDQEAIDDRKTEPRRPHGVFTDAFVRGVNGAADKDGDKQVSFAELLDFTRSRSTDFCRRKKGCGNKGLTPMLEIDPKRQSSDIRSFGRPSAAPIPTTVAQTANALLPHDNAAGVQLHILNEQGASLGNNPRVRLGDGVRYRVSAQRKGKLVLLDFNAGNHIVQLFPNSATSDEIPAACLATQASGVIAADRELLVPDSCMGFALEAEEPLGKGKVAAIWVEDIDINVSDLFANGQQPVDGFPQIADPQAWLAQLRSRLDQVFHEQDGRNRAVNWSVTSVDYEIVP